jgi:hypothetical protein
LALKPVGIVSELLGVVERGRQIESSGKKDKLVSTILKPRSCIVIQVVIAFCEWNIYFYADNYFFYKLNVYCYKYNVYS